MRSDRIDVVLACAVAASLALGCVSEDGAAGRQDRVADDPPSAEANGRLALPAASAGCAKPAPVASGESALFEIPVGDLAREYLLHLPSTYDSAQPTSLVLDFHGYTGTSVSEEIYTGLSKHADEYGYIVVYPQGTGFTVGDQLFTSWNDLAGNASVGPAGPVCAEDADFYPPPPECGDPKPCVWASCYDDLGFVEQLLDRLEADFCIDLDRVYATGMSAGAMFVHRLGCAMPERFAAIAPVGGTLLRGFNCAPTAPLAMMNIYGSRDDYVSQKGVKSSDGYYYESAEDVLGTWAAAQSCDVATAPFDTTRDGVSDLACLQHDNCRAGAEVVHCAWDGAHDWPQTASQSFGNQIIWEFFSNHSRSAFRAHVAEEVEEL